MFLILICLFKAWYGHVVKLGLYQMIFRAQKLQQLRWAGDVGCRVGNHWGRSEYSRQKLKHSTQRNGKGKEKPETSFQVTKTTYTSYVVKSTWKWDCSFRFCCSSDRSSLLPMYVTKERPGANLSSRERQQKKDSTLFSWELDLSSWIYLLPG